MLLVIKTDFTVFSGVIENSQPAHFQVTSLTAATFAKHSKNLLIFLAGKVHLRILYFMLYKCALYWRYVALVVVLWRPVLSASVTALR